MNRQCQGSPFRAWRSPNKEAPAGAGAWEKGGCHPPSGAALMPTRLHAAAGPDPGRLPGSGASGHRRGAPTCGARILLCPVFARIPAQPVSSTAFRCGSPSRIRAIRQQGKGKRSRRALFGHETVTSRSTHSVGLYSRTTTMRSGCPSDLGNSSMILNLLSWCVGSSTHSMLYR